MTTFLPDYNNLVMAAKNQTPNRIPIYEHLISPLIMEKCLDVSFASHIDGNKKDIEYYFENVCRFFQHMTYDTVSFECIVTEIMPGNGALYHNQDGCIKTMDDFEKYPWHELKERFFAKNQILYETLHKTLPAGMKAVGGIGNGIFECVQDVVGYEQLCYIKADDPELYAKLFQKVAQVLYELWTDFLSQFQQDFCVLRFGDDLGYKSQTLLPKQDIVTHILPGYQKIIQLVHSYQKPFLLHSCGNLFDIMEDVINIGVDAKHSNEDEIAPMKTWYEKYGDRIGNFGGIDADVLCRSNKETIKEYVTKIYQQALDHNGVALGSGNSIPEYTPVENYQTMIETINGLRLT